MFRRQEHKKRSIKEFVYFLLKFHFMSIATDLSLMIIAILSALLVVGSVSVAVIAGIVFARNEQLICKCNNNVTIKWHQWYT